MSRGIGQSELVGFAGEALEIEGDDVIEHGIVLVSYLNGDDGNRETGWVVIGEPAIDQTIGLLAIAQHRIDHHTTGSDLND